MQRAGNGKSNVDAVGSDLTVSAAAVSCNVNQVEFKTSVPASINEGSITALEVMEDFAARPWSVWRLRTYAG